MSESTFTVDRENLQVISGRIMDATPERLWEAYTNADQVAQWWGPRALTTKMDTYDVREGGSWRIIHADSAGQEYAFHGEFKEVVEPTKIVQTFIFEMFPDTVMTETITFEAQADGTTKLTDVAHFPNLEALEGMVNSGMESGNVESLERLAELLAQ